MKRLLLLSGVLIALVAVAWATGMFGGPVSTLDLPDLIHGGGEVTRVEISSGEEHVSAHRLDSGDWQLDEPVQAKADSATVMRLVRQVGKIELESIVSTSPERFDRFEVDTAGSRLIVERGGRRLDLIVGKMGPDFQSRYVRIEGDNRIMLANGLPPLSAKLDQWRDKMLWLLPADAVTGVSITNESISYRLVKADGGWHLESGSESPTPDSSEIANLIGRLTTFKVDGFQPDLTIDSVLTNVTHRVRIELAGGTSETLLMRKRKSDVAAVREGSSDVFKLFSYRLTNLAPKIETLTASTGQP